MSGEEPGYVPPDHKTTAEFRVRGRAAEPGAAAAGPEATFVDRPVDGPSGATLQDVPQDDPQDGPDVTFQDSLIPGLDDEEPVTVTDGRAASDTATDAPKSSDTVTDVPLPSVRSAPEAAVFAMPAPEPAAEPATEPATEPAAEKEAAALEEQAPPAAAAQTGGQPAVQEGPWTEQFAAEAETPGPVPPGPAPPPPPAEPVPAVAYSVPGAPPQDTMPAAASPSGGVPPSEGVPPSGPPRSKGPSKGPLLLVALAGGLVLLLAAAGVTVLLLTGGPGKDDGARAGTSPAPSAPATEGGGPAPATSGGPAPSGAPTAPPAGGAPGTPPGSGAPGVQPASPPVPTAPIGPVLRGTGITYQLVQQDPGYFEGRMVITNRTDEPMKTWKLTFRTPGADVKNIWGAKLAKGGEKVEIKNLDDAPAIPPGGTWEVQFGASGATVPVKDCKLNGKACGF